MHQNYRWGCKKLGSFGGLERPKLDVLCEDDWNVSDKLNISDKT